MERIIKSMEDKYLLPALELVEEVFTEYENPEDARITRTLVEEIRSKRFYLPAPECLMVTELVPGALANIHGQVCYADYECLH